MSQMDDMTLRLDMALEAAQLGVWDLNLDTNTITMNNSWCKQFLYPLDENTFDTEQLLAKVHPDSRKKVIQAILKIIHRKSDSFELVYYFQDGKGQWRPVKTKGKAVKFDSKGCVQCILGTQLDMTQNFNKEREIERLRERVSLSLEASNIGVWEWKLLDNALTWDEQMFQIYGESPESFTGIYEFWESRIHPDDFEEFSVHINCAILERKKLSAEFRVLRPNGEIRHLKIVADVKRNKRGEALSLVGVCWDITVENEKNKELYTLNERYDLTIKGASVGIWDRPDVFSEHEVWSPRFYELLGYENNEIEANHSNFVKLLHPDDVKVNNKAIQNHILGNTKYDVEYRMKCKSGIYKWFRGTGLTTYDHEGIPKRFVGSIIDIDEAKKNRDQLKNALEEADKASKSKSQFLANMSHELRTPLNAIIGYSELLMEEIPQELAESISDLKKIKDSGGHLLNLINQILDISKIESGKMEAYLEPIIVDNLLSDIKNLVQPMIDKNRNIFIVEKLNVPKVISSDSDKLKQILVNLISNAAKFTKDGSIKLKINNDEENQGEYLQIEVEDTGVGIPENKLSSIFDEFSQADDSTTRIYGGTGLGLSICKKFAELLNGSIEVQSQLGKGSCFKLLLPVEKHQEKPNMSLFESESLLPSNKVSALVIDDELTARDLFRRTLEPQGYAVFEAASGVEGIRIAEKIMPNIIILDVLMPNKDGWSVLANLKTNPLTSEIPVIVVSMLDSRETAYSLGASECLLKPVDNHKFLEIIKNQLVKHLGQILIIDDNRKMRELMKRNLEKEHFQVIALEDGRSALYEFEKGLRPDLVIFDLILPHMNGFELIHRMEQIGVANTSQFIVVTDKSLSKSERTHIFSKVQKVARKGQYTPSQMLEDVKSLLKLPIQEQKAG